jgi:Caspase domain
MSIIPMLAGGPLAAEPPGGKFALVIGNNYSGASEISGIADATSVAESLEDIGFKVVSLFDARIDAITPALEEFRKRIASAEVALFFYSGHGYQINGVNYLLPVESEINPQDPQVPIDRFIWSLSGAPTSAVKLLFLDACRTNASLSVAGGGELENVPGWSPGLAKPPAGVPQRTLFSYAAAPGRAAESGQIGDLSPYSNALAASIREPGLEIREFLSRVHDDVFRSTGRRQSPLAEGFDRIPLVFYLREPVFIRMAIDEPDDDLFVVLNGRIVRSYRRDRQLGGNIANGALPLKAGDNELSLLAYNQRSLQNNQMWGKTEGWHFKMRVLAEDGSELSDGLFEEGEEVPFKDGPHHGQLFEAARAILEVDKETAKLRVKERKTDVWNLEAPFYAQDQAELDKRSLRQVAREVFGFDIGSLGGFLDSRYAVVYGNRSLEPKVKDCMNQPERRADLVRSIIALASGDQRPFDDFLKRLVDCVGTPVWTALENQ